MESKWYQVIFAIETNCYPHAEIRIWYPIRQLSLKRHLLQQKKSVM